MEKSEEDDKTIPLMIRRELLKEWNENPDEMECTRCGKIGNLKIYWFTEEKIGIPQILCDSCSVAFKDLKKDFDDVEVLTNRIQKTLQEIVEEDPNKRGTRMTWKRRFIRFLAGFKSKLL